VASTNKVHRVTTIERLAEQLGQDEEFLADLAEEMDAEAGLIWVYGTGDAADRVMAFTDFGVETLTDLIDNHQRDQSPPALPTGLQ
jgi:hypothetical protein